MFEVTFGEGEIYIDKDHNMIFEDPYHPGVMCYLDAVAMEIGYSTSTKVPKRDWKKLLPPKPKAKGRGRPRKKN